MQFPGAGHPFDRPHVATRARKAEHETGKHGRSIEQHGARAAFAQLAAVLRARKSKVFAEHFEQRLVRSERDLGALTVYREADLGLRFVARGHDVI
jgi:hypothetical protein